MINLIKKFRQWLKSISKYLSVLVLVGIPAIAIWGLIWPWEPAEQCFAVIPQSGHFFAGLKVSYVKEPGRFSRTESHAYVMLPAKFDWPTLVTISKTDDEPATASNPSLFGFLALIGSMAVAAYTVWNAWFRRKNGR